MWSPTRRWSSPKTRAERRRSSSASPWVWASSNPVAPLGISKLGEVYVRADANISPEIRGALEAAIGRPERDEDDVPTGILRLNNRTLRAARVAAIDQERTRLAREFGAESASRGDREARASEMLRRDIYPSYVSVRVGYLRRTLGKHKPGQP